jgi:hypothetical protein
MISMMKNAIRKSDSTKVEIFSHLEGTEAEYRLACDEYWGCCVKCGAIQFGGVEPDAEKYECEECNKEAVYGIEQLMMYGRVKIVGVE